MTRAATAVVVAAALLLAGCSGSGGLCADLDGLDFRSEENISAILGPEGVEPSPEFIDFRGDTADWLYGDVVETGEWSCRDNRVTGFDGRLDADLVEEAGDIVMIWNNNRFIQS